MPFLPVISLITDHPPLALRARVLIRRNPISSQSDCPKPPKAEGLISLHQGACVWLGNRTTTPPPLASSLSGPLRHDLSVLFPVGLVSPGQGSVVRGNGRVGETTVQGSKQASFRGARTRRETRWVGRRKNSSSVSTQSHGYGKITRRFAAAAAAAACRRRCSYSFPLCFVPSADGPMRNSFPVQVFSRPHTTWR